MARRWSKRSTRANADVGAVGSTPPILAQAGAAPGVVYVAFAPRLQKSYGLIVPAQSTIKRVDDLKGKKIAFAKGSQGHPFVLKALADAGVPMTSVQFVYLNTATRGPYPIHATPIADFRQAREPS
ncbi:hypothetical protein PTKU64_93070 (plasmid) [Paraburkholderia terrae]|uniref:SsuA/THI5-like domain-containing protein n=1 Tax=Paraburkholderia terrae TaxID=311230 RepID=A0ABN6K130_9BURK|nr:ABC transporter substrate-binding protein [Paraburkholderia terrae]BCZ85632.1 hypothetical protein PTKU64_93070 [Paraburkholderia terrae]